AHVEAGDTGCCFDVSIQLAHGIHRLEPPAFDASPDQSIHDHPSRGKTIHEFRTAGARDIAGWNTTRLCRQRTVTPAFDVGTRVQGYSWNRGRSGQSIVLS